MSFPVFWILLMSSKICNNTSNKYLSQKNSWLCRQRKNLNDKKTLLLNYDDVTKNDADIIISITWLILQSLLESKDVLHYVSSDLGEVKRFFWHRPNKEHFSKVQKTLPGIALIFKPELLFCYHFLWLYFKHMFN